MIGLTWQSLQGSSSINDTITSSKRSCGNIRPKNLFKSFSSSATTDLPTTTTLSRKGKQGCLYETNIEEIPELQNPLEGIWPYYVIYIRVTLYVISTNLYCYMSRRELPDLWYQFRRRKYKWWWSFWLWDTNFAPRRNKWSKCLYFNNGNCF